MERWNRMKQAVTDGATVNAVRDHFTEYGDRYVFAGVGLTAGIALTKGYTNNGNVRITIKARDITILPK